MVRIIDDPFVAIVSGFCHLIWPASQGQKAFEGLLEANNNKLPTPSDILEMDPAVLKQFIAVDEHANYLRQIALQVTDKPSLLQGLKDLSPDEVRDRLTQFKGIGKWMAGWVLMYHLAHPDVVLLSDASLKRAVRTMYHREEVSDQDLANLTASWSPHISAACWYIFMAAEKVLAERKAASGGKKTEAAASEVKPIAKGPKKPEATKASKGKTKR